MLGTSELAAGAGRGVSLPAPRTQQLCSLLGVTSLLAHEPDRARAPSVKVSKRAPSGGREAHLFPEFLFLAFPPARRIWKTLHLPLRSATRLEAPTLAPR